MPSLSLTDPSQRLEAIPPYMFAELERKVADKRKAGIDVISLGIGDPDMPTFPHVVAAMQGAVADPGNQTHKAYGIETRLGFLRGRVTFVIDRDGTVAEVIRSDLNMNVHADRALEVLRGLPAA